MKRLLLSTLFTLFAVAAFAQKGTVTGTVVDADDLIEGMVSTAREMSAELGKLDGCSEEEANAVSTMVGLGALKYFILKVDPKKTMLFDPRESIDFNGNTGPFIQYLSLIHI